MVASQSWVSALVILAACTTPDAPPMPTTPVTWTVDSLPGGITRITNSGAAEWQDTSGWKWVEGRVIDPPDDSPAMLGTMGSMAFDPTGNLYVMQRPARVVVFDTTGTYVRTIGREGDGPGELEYGALGMRGDTLVIHQGWGGRLASFALDGTLLNEIPSPAIGRMSEDPMITDTLGRTWLPGAMLSREDFDGLGTKLRGPAWALVGPDGIVQDTIHMPFDRTLGQQKRWSGSVMIDGERAAASMNVPMQRELNSSPRHDGMVIFGYNDHTELILSRNGIDTSVIIQLPLARAEMTDADRAALLVTVVPAGSPFAKTAKASDLPPMWPAWTRLVVDHADRTWLTIPGNGRVANELWVIDQAGHFLGRVPVPHPNVNRAQWGKDEVAIPDSDAEGRPIIRIYKLVTSGNTTS